MSTSPTPPLSGWSRRQLLTTASGALVTATVLPRLLLPRALAAAPAPKLMTLRDPEADRVLNDAVSGGNYWEGASIDRFDRRKYDEIRLQKQEIGYLTYVSGEGREDFEHEQVVSTVWDHQDKLDNHFESTVIAKRLGSGHDSRTGSDYVDVFMLLDFGLFYARQVQRMYKFKDPGGRTLLPFERLVPSFVDAATWQRYLAIRDQEEKRVADAGKLRKVFSNIIDITELYGVFFIEPGARYKSRVSMIAKIGFEESGSWVASAGSKIPPVIKSGLRGGFDASVTVCSAVKSGRYD
jgi:hypothetical protein